MDALKLASSKINSENTEIVKSIYKIKERLFNLDEKFNGNRSKSEVGQKNNPSLSYRLRTAGRGINYQTYGPTETHRKSYRLAKKMYDDFLIEIESILEDGIPKIEKELETLGAPYVE